MSVTIRYRLSQNFAVSSKQAYLWCTDFSAQDHQLMGNSNAKRQVTRVSDDMVLLKDVFHTLEGEVEKQKLVHLYPDRLSWVSTHLTGPNRYSQFRYEILTTTVGCCLDFEALHVEYDKDNLSYVESLRLADRLCRADLALWQRLALVMEQELK